jgi:hypothetical protein
MRLSKILCLLALVSLPSAIKAQPSPNPTEKPRSTPAPTGPTGPGASQPEGSGTAPVAPAASAAAPSESAPSGAAEAGQGAAADAAQPAEGPATEPAEESASSHAVPPTAQALGVAPGDGPAPELSIPSPGELGDRLAGDLPPPEEKHGWAAPTPVLTLHGYLRARGELMDHFWLGRANGASGADPFTRFKPIERANATAQCAGGSAGTEGDLGGVCKIDTLRFASMRFRFSPQLNVSEDVRIKSTFDILDNYVLGDGPVSYYGTGDSAAAAFPGTNIPTGSLILPRRVWAEVRNRDLGELRFGLMPDHWGLGMLANAGNGLDDDFSTDVGRIMGTTKVLGFYLSAMYDFANEGKLGAGSGIDRPGYDGSQIQDFDRGARFQVSSAGSVLTSANAFKDLRATLYTPDVWAQLRFGKLRLELEAAWIVGSLLNRGDNRTTQYVSQLGGALESELRLVNDKLGLYLYAGGATGDSEVEGLSSDANFIDHAGQSGSQTADSSLNNNRVSSFRFHPAYRVDLILWRNIMRQVTSAMYVKPGISYDFVRDSFGQLIGARVDLVYSRAASPIQTWGNDPNLGVEIDAQVYWRSADGPNLNDGYHAMLQYGVLFPMKGLGYMDGSQSLHNAQTLRLVLGVMF